MRPIETRGVRPWLLTFAPLGLKRRSKVASTSEHLDRVLSGEQRGVGAAVLRGLLAVAEPFYSGIIRARNRLYDAGILSSHRLAVPVISVGNITAGGTGKTPVVHWLVGRLQAAGLRPAILMRGYKREGSALSDEQALLQESLGQEIIVHAQADRVAGGKAVLARHPETNVLVLDDGFQHRRLHRDFDLVLVDAMNPFGCGHVLPRGLLREPVRGLARADAFILTRSNQVEAEQRRRLEEQLRGHNHRAPVYLARHVHAGLRSPAIAASADPDLPLDMLAQRPFFAFAGIGRPSSLHQQLEQFQATYRGNCWFGDHHSYCAADLESIREQASGSGAEVLLTTEKDWVKLRSLPGALDGMPPILRLALQIDIEPKAAAGLLSLIQARIARD
jgi:tetraacyldisaccharide 4'-kinase